MKETINQLLIGRVLRDTEFRKRLCADPEKTLRTEGFAANPGLVAAIKKVDPAALDKMASAYEGAGTTNGGTST